MKRQGSAGKGGRPPVGTVEEPVDKPKRTKAANGAGTLERRGALWYVQVLRAIEPGETKRRRGRLPIEGSEAMTEAQARRASKKTLGDWRAGKLTFVPTPRRKGDSPAPSSTVRQIGEAWTSGELLKTHGAVNGLRPMVGGYIMSKTLGKRAYCVKTRGEDGPDFGDLPVADVQHRDIAKVMAAQTGAAGTRNHVHNYLARIFALSEIPLGLRAIGSNPVLKAYRAPPDEGLHFNFLYPPELIAMLGNRKIPVGRRVLYLLANYFGWRKGSLYAFKWSGIDWTAGTVSVLKQKGYRRLDADEEDEEQGRPIFFVARADTVAVLRAWYEHCGRPETESPVVRDWEGEPPPGTGRGRPPTRGIRKNHSEAAMLRADLKASGVTRAILFSQAKNVAQIRFHDGRASFCSWARLAGFSDVWIRERTGHSPTSDMVDRYARMAQTLADLNYEPFPDVTDAIPELAEAARKWLQLPPQLPQGPQLPHREAIPELPQVPVTIQCEGRDLNPHASYGASTSS